MSPARLFTRVKDGAPRLRTGAAMMRARIAGSRLVILPNSGLMTFVCQPGMFNQAVDDFLNAPKKWPDGRGRGRERDRGGGAGGSSFCPGFESALAARVTRLAPDLPLTNRDQTRPTGLRRQTG